MSYKKAMLDWLGFSVGELECSSNRQDNLWTAFRMPLIYSLEFFSYSWMCSLSASNEYRHENEAAYWFFSMHNRSRVSNPCFPFWSKSAASFSWKSAFPTSETYDQQCDHRQENDRNCLRVFSSIQIDRIRFLHDL